MFKLTETPKSQFVNPYLDFDGFSSGRLYAYDYLDENCKVFNDDNISIELIYNLDNNVVQAFWPDDKMLIHLPIKSGAKWKDDANLLTFFILENSKIKNSRSGKLEKGSDDQKPFNLQYVFSNDDTSDGIYYNQEHYDEDKIEIPHRKFYHTSFDLEKTFYIHSEIIDTIKVPIPDLRITDYVDSIGPGELEPDFRMSFNPEFNIRFEEKSMDNIRLKHLEESYHSLKIDLDETYKVKNCEP